MELIIKFVNDIFILTRRTFYGPAGRLRVTQITPPAYGPAFTFSSIILHYSKLPLLQSIWQSIHLHVVVYPLPYTNIKDTSTLQGLKTLSLTTTATHQTFPQTPTQSVQQS